MIEPVAIADVNVAGNVPAGAHVLLLAVYRIQVPAAGRTFDREQTRSTVRHRSEPALVDHHGLIARHNLTRSARPGTTRPRGNEDVQHFGGSEAIQNFDASLLLPRTIDGRRQRFSGADHEPQ